MKTDLHRVLKGGTGMSWTREEVKLAGKDAFRRNYGSSVAAALIYSLFEGVRYQFEWSEIDIELFAHVTAQLSPVLLLALIFVIQVVEVGVCRFFVENRDYNAPVSKVWFGFRCGHYKNVVATMAIKQVKVFLWGLLLVIPGIVKSYEYIMVPYILAEQPDIRPKDALQISSDMMMGNKMDVLVLKLSFIGWSLLSLVTCGLSEIFWTTPYEKAAEAEVYVALREEWIRRYGSE